MVPQRLILSASHSPALAGLPFFLDLPLPEVSQFADSLAHPLSSPMHVYVLFDVLLDEPLVPPFRVDARARLLDW